MNAMGFWSWLLLWSGLGVSLALAIVLVLPYRPFRMDPEAEGIAPVREKRS